jgi:hypothetical protein
MSTGVLAVDAEVMQPAAVAQGELAELVDGVVADAEVARRVGRRRKHRSRHPSGINSALTLQPIPSSTPAL